MKKISLVLISFIACLLIMGCDSFVPMFLPKTESELNRVDVLEQSLSVTKVDDQIADSRVLEITLVDGASLFVRTDKTDFKATISEGHKILVEYTGDATAPQKTEDVKVQVCSKDGTDVYLSENLQMTVGGWKKLEASDLSWKYNNNNSGTFAVNADGDMSITSSDGGHHWLKLNEKYKEVKIERADNTSFLFFTEFGASNSYAHNGIFLGTGGPAAGSHYTTDASVNWNNIAASEFGDALKDYSTKDIKNVSAKRFADNSVVFSHDGEYWMTFDTSLNNIEIANSEKCFGFFLAWNKNAGEKKLYNVLVRE